MQNFFSKKFLGLLFFSFVLLFKSMAVANTGGILIPFYIYPTTAAIQPLLNEKLAHPNVPMRVILNPASGPGTTADPTYVAAIAALHLAGIEVAGYVYTNYDARAISAVEADIATWQSLYQPDGIFLDTMGTNLSYYSTLSSYIYSLGMTFSIGNAGSNVATNYTTAVNTVVIDTNSGLPNLINYTDWSNANLPPSDVAMLLYNVTNFPTGFIYEAKKFTGWLYITDGGGMSPWSTLPSYFAQLMNALDTVNVGTIFPFYIYPTATAIAPLISTANEYPNVPIWVILNPATGPGTSVDPTYTAAVASLRAAGINILGYVNTNYGNRSKSTVEKDIKTWMTFYAPDGIFLDLMAVNHTYYSSVTAYAKGLGFQQVVGNPGTNINQSAGADVDIVNIFENNYLPSPISQFSNWYNVYPPADLSLLAYDISPLPTSFITQAAQYFGWIFVTDCNDADPYDAYPTYFNSFIQLLSTQ